MTLESVWTRISSKNPQSVILFVFMQCFMNALIENSEINTWNFISLNVKKTKTPTSLFGMFCLCWNFLFFLLQSKVWYNCKNLGPFSCQLVTYIMTKLKEYILVIRYQNHLCQIKKAKMWMIRLSFHNVLTPLVSRVRLWCEAWVTACRHLPLLATKHENWTSADINNHVSSLQLNIQNDKPRPVTKSQSGSNQRQYNNDIDPCHFIVASS